MPLRNHFHPPESKKHRWDAVHGQWPAMIVRQMFDLLPPPYLAAPKIRLGSPSDNAARTPGDDDLDSDTPMIVGVETAPALSPTLTVEADLSEPDLSEVLVYDEDLGRQPVAAIELVSPLNKDGPYRCRQFSPRSRPFCNRTSACRSWTW